MQQDNLPQTLKDAPSQPLRSSDVPYWEVGTVPSRQMGFSPSQRRQQALLLRQLRRDYYGATPEG